MVTIRHKQLNEVKKIPITTWRKPGQYNHELWEVMEIRDVVDLYSCDSGEWILHNTVELDAAKEVVSQHPNTFKYEPSEINTPKIRNITPRVNVDSVLTEATQGIIIKRADESSEREDIISILLEHGLLDELNDFYSISRLGREALEVGGYENWRQSKMTRSERVFQLLEEVSKRGYISTSKETSEVDRRAIDYAVAKGLLERSNNSYTLTGNGYDVLDVGSLDLWMRQQEKPLPAVNYYNNATHIQGSEVSGAVSNHVNNSQTTNVTNEQVDESKSWHYWVGWAIAILAGLAGLYWGGNRS